MINGLIHLIKMKDFTGGKWVNNLCGLEIDGLRGGFQIASKMWHSLKYKKEWNGPAGILSFGFGMTLSQERPSMTLRSNYS